MLNLSRIQLELERAKEKLRNVEETIQKVEGKTFSNGPARYSGLKVELHSDKLRNPPAIEDVKNPRRRVIASAVDLRAQRLSTDDASFNLKRGLRDKRESGVGLKRQTGDNRPQGVFARLSGPPYQQADDEDDEDFGKKPTLPSRVYTTAAEAPSRQEVIAAQAVDEQSKQRNRRMFGALVGTLQKFRKEETRVREREEKRLKVEKKLEEDAKREKEKLMQEKRELFLEKKRREVEIKRIEWSLNRVKEYEAWEANVLPLKNYIQTQAKPHIFYLPTLHNSKTEERLAHSQKLVERMIEKRKTNLKEEIENSEKKARKAAAEEAEAEEAENIPEDNEEANNTKQQMQIDYEPENNENGYLEEEKKNQMENKKDVDEGEESGKVEEKWDKVEDPEGEKSGEFLGNEKELNSTDGDDSKEEPPLTENKDSVKEFNGIREDRQGDAGGPLGKTEDDVNKVRDGDDEKCDSEERKKTEIEPNFNAEESVGDSSEAFGSILVPLGESENVEKEEVDDKERETSDFVKSNEDTLDKNSELEETDKKGSLSVSEPKTEDSLNKKQETAEEKEKSKEKSRPREKSRSRKTSRRSRSPRKSRSPRDSSSNRRRSSSRRRRTLRRRSPSDSPPRKSRRSRSPVSRRGRRNFPPRRRSPLGKSRRRSSSRSSSSVSRSSSGSSKSD